MGIPFYAICCFSLVTFDIFSLSLLFVNLIAMCLSIFPLGLSCLGFCFLHFSDYFLSHIREVFNYYLFKYFLTSFLFSFWNPYNVYVLCLMLWQRSSFLFGLSLFFFMAVISIIPSCSSLIQSSAFLILLLSPASVFFTVVILFFISLCSLDSLAFY